MYLTMKLNKSLFWFGIIILFTGDVYWLASLFFKSFAIDSIMVFSTEFNSSQLNAAGENVLLLLAGILGSLLYLVGFLIIALSSESRPDQIKLIYAGLIVWFLADSIASLVYGFYWNIAFNTVFLTTGLIFLKNINE